MGLVEPRSTWATVVFIASLGFVNYVLWKIYGSRGTAITAFLGGLFSSASVVASAGNLAAHSALANRRGQRSGAGDPDKCPVSLPLIARVAGQPRLTASLRTALLQIVAVGLVGAILQSLR